MDINIIYNKIIEKLESSNHSELITELENSSASAVTGSEGLIATGSYLLKLKKDNPLVYNLIEKEIKDYRKYCKQNGIILLSQ